MKKKVILITAIAILLAALVACGIYFISTAAAGGSIEERRAAADTFVEEGKIKKAENTYKSIIKEDSEDIATSKKTFGALSQKPRFQERGRALDTDDFG